MRELFSSCSFRCVGRDEFDNPRILVWDGDLQNLAFRLDTRGVDMKNTLLFCRHNFLNAKILEVFPNRFAVTNRPQEWPLYIDNERSLPADNTFHQVHPSHLGMAHYAGKYVQTCSDRRSRYQLNFIMRMLFKTFRTGEEERIFVGITQGTGDMSSLPEFLAPTLRLENSILLICTKDSREDFCQ